MAYKYPSLRTTMPVLGYYASLDAGASATNQFGAGLGGTLTNVTRISDIGTVYSFASGFITTSAQSLGAVNTLSIAAWIRPQTGDLTNRSAIFSTREGNIAGSFSFEIGSGSGGNGRIVVTTPGVFNLETANSVITAGTWQHVGLMRSGSTQRVYVNGVEIAKAVDAPVSFVDNSAAKLIGRINAGAYQFTGRLDDLLVWPVDLSAADFGYLAAQRGAIYELAATTQRRRTAQASIRSTF